MELERKKEKKEKKRLWLVTRLFSLYEWCQFSMGYAAKVDVQNNRIEINQIKNDLDNKKKRLTVAVFIETRVNPIL